MILMFSLLHCVRCFVHIQSDHTLDLCNICRMDFEAVLLLHMEKKKTSELLPAEYALVAFIVIDYITGVMCAISDKTLSSAVGFRGICRKVLIFLLVGIANILDTNVIGTGSVLRTAAIFFYISNEGVSLLENAAHLGLPVPGAVKDVLEQLHNRAEKGADDHEQSE